ncbi:hypothetical protein Tcan_16807, partial [Toxocara canis]
PIKLQPACLTRHFSIPTRAKLLGKRASERANSNTLHIEAEPRRAKLLGKRAWKSTERANSNTLHIEARRLKKILAALS